MLTVCIWILVCYLIIIFTTLISTLYVYIYIFIYICSVFWKESPLFPSTTFSPITFLVCCTRYTRILTRYSVTTPNPVASWVFVKYNVCSLFSEGLFDRRNTWGYIFVNQTKIQHPLDTRLHQRIDYFGNGVYMLVHMFVFFFFSFLSFSFLLIIIINCYLRLIVKFGYR